MEWSIFNYLYYSKIAKAYLLYSSLSNMLVELGKGDYETILEIQRNPDIIDPKEEQYNFLINGSFLVESNENEINKLKLTSFINRFNTKTLSLTIAPTQACNFNCSYCYESNRVNKKMTQNIIDQILYFVENKYNSINSLNVTWYGGEPTLEIETIKYLSGELHKRVNNYHAFMVTNGYHLDKIVNSIDTLNIKGLQITLDGSKETHNKTRCLKNGGGGDI